MKREGQRSRTVSSCSAARPPIPQGRCHFSLSSVPRKKRSVSHVVRIGAQFNQFHQSARPATSDCVYMWAGGRFSPLCIADGFREDKIAPVQVHNPIFEMKLPLVFTSVNLKRNKMLIKKLPLYDNKAALTSVDLLCSADQYNRFPFTLLYM